MPQDMYQCLVCKKAMPVKTGQKPPMCCGKPMKKESLDVCVQPSHPEHARFSDSDEPCDDSRGANIQVHPMVECAVCKNKTPEEHMKHIKIKGNEKKICPQCVASIKGIV